MYESLTRYIGRLNQAVRKTVSCGGMNYSFLSYDETVLAYSRDIHALMSPDAPDYRDYVNEHSVSLSDNLKFINIASLSGQTILYLLLFIETAEKKHAGFRSEFIRNGFINDALKRLQELDESNPLV